MEARLEALLAALRAAGLHVGVEERLRLLVVIDKLSQSDDLSIGRAIIAIVAKAPEERALAERVVLAWAEAHRPASDEGEEEAPGPVEAARALAPRRPADVAVAEVRRSARRVWRWRRWIGAGAAVVALAALTWWAWPEPATTPIAAAPETPAPVAVDPVDPTTPEPKIAPIEFLVPRFGEPDPFDPPEPWGAIVTLALSALAGLLVLRARPRDPPLPAVPEDRGLAPPLPGAGLRPGEILRLDPGDQEALATGLGQRLTGEPTPVLDVERTVAATAASMGLPRLRYVEARERLGLWLWVDTGADQPEVEALARDLSAAMEAAGLPRERADFVGSPELLHTPDGPSSPLDLARERRGARLVVLSDGVGVEAALRADAQGTGLTPILREMADWDGLLWVDFGDMLRHLLPGHRVVSPDELVVALCGDGGPRLPVPAELELWRALCALCPEPVPLEAALRLRARLGLRVSPWWASALGKGEVLSWTEGERAAILGWLEAATGYVEAPGVGTLGPAIGFWRETLEQTEQSARETPGWPGSEAQARLAVSRALVDLWDRPGEAIDVLWHLHLSGLGAEVRSAVARLCDAEHRHPAAIRLPWRVAELGAEHRQRLAKLGFGAAVGVRLEGVVQPPGRRAVGAAAIGGAAAAAVIVVFTWDPAVPQTRVVEEGDRGGEPAWTDCEGGDCRAGSRSVVVELKGVSSGTKVPVSWGFEPRPCEEDSADGGKLLRCNMNGQPPTPWQGRPTFSLVQLVTGDLTAARDCALAFLDSGDADGVLISPDPAALTSYLPPADTDAQHLIWDLRAGPGPLSTCRAALQLAATTPAHVALGLPEPATAFILGPWRPITSPPPPEPTPIDTDGDGTPDETDCAPQDPGIHPGARDIPGDGIDQDCSGDDTPAPAVAIVAPPPPEPDADADGTPDETDCAPQDPGIHPGATDIPGDGIDQDCSGDDTPTPHRANRWITIPGGEGVIGDDNGNDDDEKPRWRVKWSAPYELLETEVTNAQYAERNPGWTYAPDKADHPVAYVNWSQARDYCRAIGGRLPTEAEWEYAARAGTETAYSFGDDASKLGDYAWYSGNSGYESHPVAQKLPNAWGLYDMHGNVWEWVEDVYNADNWRQVVTNLATSGDNVSTTVNKVVIDPSPFVNSVDNSPRVYRGGSFGSVPGGLRSSYRSGFNPQYQSVDLGFRCVRGPERQP